MEQQRGRANPPNGADWEEGYAGLLGWADVRAGKLSPGQHTSLREYCRLLYAGSEKTNLISPGDRKDIATKHVLPALRMGEILSLVPNKVVLDFGSGAGIPGIPLKILFPENHFILVDSRRRRANFLREVVRRLGLKSIEVHNRRIEDLYEQLSGVADVVVTRAASDLGSLLSWVGPTLKPHGVVLTTLDSQRGYQQSRGLLIRRKSEGLGYLNWVGMLR